MYHCFVDHSFSTSFCSDISGLPESQLHGALSRRVILGIGSHEVVGLCLNAKSIFYWNEIQTFA